MFLFVLKISIKHHSNFFMGFQAKKNGRHGILCMMLPEMRRSLMYQRPACQVMRIKKKYLFILRERGDRMN